MFQLCQIAGNQWKELGKPFKNIYTFIGMTPMVFETILPRKNNVWQHTFFYLATTLSEPDVSELLKESYNTATQIRAHPGRESGEFDEYQAAVKTNVCYLPLEN